MKTYQTKPIAVKAFQVTEKLLLEALINKKQPPFGLHASGSFHPEDRKLYYGRISIPTPTGNLQARMGEWIVQRADGELTLLRDDQFKDIYE